MADRVIPAGKLPAPLLARLLRQFPAAPAEVLVGPAIGEDACAIDIPAGTLVAATDPITFSGVRAGRHAVIVNANDVAVAGVRPRWFLAAVIMPVGCTAHDIEVVFADIQEGLAMTGAALVGGHTEVSAAVTRPVVVGHMLGLAEQAPVLSSGGMRAGDVVVQIGPVPVEGAYVLAVEATDRLGDLDPVVVSAALAAVDDPGISVVEPALLAAQLGATALHDPTEGGLAGALHELAGAAGVALRIDPDQVQWFEAGVAVCAALGADPWGTLASGALLAAFAPSRARSAVGALTERGHRVAAIGTARPGAGVSDLSGRPLAWPDRDEVARVLGA